jgi:Na+-transporting NADH:ubiquinone oxidoreductase subunit NqrF
MDVEGILKASPAESHIYVCGPPGLVDSVRETAVGLGLTPDQIHFESFGALWIATDEPVHLELTLSGLTLDVPIGQTLLETIEAAGVWVPYDCRRGECHMCMTQVVDGQPVHCVPSFCVAATHWHRHLLQSSLCFRPILN